MFVKNLQIATNDESCLLFVDLAVGSPFASEGPCRFDNLFSDGDVTAIDLSHRVLLTKGIKLDIHSFVPIFDFFRRYALDLTQSRGCPHLKPSHQE